MEIDDQGSVSEVDDEDLTSVKDSDRKSVLWLALAGPPRALPKKWDLVVYFPQGHLEYAASLSSLPPTEALTFGLQPQIICRVVDVRLLVNKKNDEVYIDIILLPDHEPESVGQNSKGKQLERSVADEEGNGGSPSKPAPCLIGSSGGFSGSRRCSSALNRRVSKSSCASSKSTFLVCSKKLKDSHTTKAETFSISGRAADRVFVHLRNAQWFVALDVHGVQWRFCYFYCGQEKLHQFTEGWRNFVRQKKLVSGDTVVFLRDKKKLMLGIRKAVHSKNGVSDSIVAMHNPYPNVLSTVADAVVNGNSFHVFYNPRDRSHAGFVISYQKYRKSITKPVQIGTEFRMPHETDDSSQSCAGVVTGLGDLDTCKWSESIWRCLMVNFITLLLDTDHRINMKQIDMQIQMIRLLVRLCKYIGESHNYKTLLTSLQEHSAGSFASEGFIPLKSPRSFRVLQGEASEGLAHYADDTIKFNADDAVDFSSDLDLRSSRVLEGQANEGLPPYADDTIKPCAEDTVNVIRDFDLNFPISVSTQGSLIHSPPRLKRHSDSLQDSTEGFVQSKLLKSSRVLRDQANKELPPFMDDTAKPSADDTVSLTLDLGMNFPDRPSLCPVQFTPFSYEDKTLTRRTGEALQCLEIDSVSSLASLNNSKSATSAIKQLRISKCQDLNLLIDQMAAHSSLEYLEFDCCLFRCVLLQDYFPSTLKKLKIINCVNIDEVLRVLVSQKGLSLEYLEIDHCSSLFSFPIDKLPTTLRQLKIVNCMNLKSFNGSLTIENEHSLVIGQEGDSNLVNMTLSSTLQLRKLEIWDCVELELLPEELHNLTHLDLLSISNCSSLMSFPEGGLPKTSLTSLLIFECESLKSLPNNLHEVRSLQTFSVFGCPCLVSFPEGGLPPNLVSLSIVDCENLISLPYWELHKLKHLKEYSIISGLPDLGVKSSIFERESIFDV
ncbi:hypothetical protein Pint_23886 [Pistacia integerrima]|uniref:Uncharacterized protein n=1 Tax=Pistacia integerrima TaxID=434235 RepID=A0ACC0YQD7_9ROSI|nr:hypothetical protein Pint_23886 [Pistacia integerrima]